MERFRIRSRELASAFGGEPQMLNAHVVRLCVLYEDLRIEVTGATADEELRHLDDCGFAVRRLYFTRRAICSLLEVAEAFRILHDDHPKEEQVLLEHFPEKERRAWQACREFFATAEGKLCDIRNDVGGHFGFKAALYAVQHLDDVGIGFLEIMIDAAHERGGARFKFVEQICTAALHKQREQNETSAHWNERMAQLMTEGLEHTGSVMGTLASYYIYPKFKLVKN